jgi:hypothetical protein
MPNITTAEEALAIVNQLSPEEKARLIGKLAEDLAQETKQQQPKRDFYGALSHLGTAPSAEDIDEVRREMWAGFAEGDDY